MWSDRFVQIQDMLAKHSTAVAGELKQVKINLVDDQNIGNVLAYKDPNDGTDTINVSMGFITMIHFVVMADESLSTSQFIGYIKYYTTTVQIRIRAPGTPLLDPLDWARWSKPERDCFEQDDQKLQELLKLETGTVAFVLAHELGHHILGHTAVPTTDVEIRRQREVAADKFASDTMLASDVGPLIGGFALLYYAALDSYYTALFGDAATYQKKSDHPMSVSRVEALMNSELTNLDKLTISSGISKNQVSSQLRNLAASVEKGLASGDFRFVSSDPWSRGGTRPDVYNRFENDSGVSSAISQDGAPGITWHTTQTRPTVDYKIKYMNKGDATIECLLQVVVGAVPRDTQLASSWAELSKNTHYFFLGPHQENTIQGTLVWGADATHMPRIEYPDPSRNHEPAYYKCRSK